MECSCIDDYGFFQGDDLIDAITVNRPKDTEDITIIQCELQVGPLTIIEVNPVFPYDVSIMREDSVKLGVVNKVYLRVVYNDSQGHTGVRKTCLGELKLKVNKQVVTDVETSTDEGTGDNG